MIRNYTIAWIGLVILAIVNGTARVKGYGRFMSELAAHQLSTLTGILLFGLYVWGLGFLWKLRSAREAIIIGLIWLVMTICFEFLFGHYVMKHPWSRLFHDYNVVYGRLWSLVLLWTAIAPYLFYRLRN